MILTKRKYSALDLLRLIFRFAPFHAALKFLIVVVEGLSVSIGVLATAGFIDTAILIAQGEAVYAQAAPYILTIIAVMAYRQTVNSINNFVKYGIENRLKVQVRIELAELRAMMEYRYIENRETRDLIERVSKDADVKLRDMYDQTLSLVRIAVTLAGLVGVLLAHAWWLVVILTLFCVPLFLVGVKAGQKTYDAKKETTKLDRAAKNYSDMLFSRENIDERFIFGFEKDINAKYSDAFEQARIYKKKVDKKNFIAMKTGSVLLVIANCAMALPLVYAAVNSQITVGLFMSIIPALNSFAHLMSWQLTTAIRDFKQNLEYMKDLEKFMALEACESYVAPPQNPPVLFEKLEFNNVSFKYPGMEQYILKDMSMTIERGRHYAVVGANGAGKTTFTKLITGLYHEYEGEILLNGRDLRRYSAAEIKSCVSVVYQDFARYSLSVAENIAFGDANLLEKTRGDALSFSAKDSGNTELYEKLENAAELLGLKEAIDKLPNGFDAHLGKIKADGADLSGGEWQRVAMARAVVSPAGLKILDEPTAALDPISESNIYKDFEKISNGSTTIFISHRLGSTKLADVIFVVSGGKIAEQGTHEELMRQNGEYARMYRSQAEWYVNAAQAKEVS